MGPVSTTSRPKTHNALTSLSWSVSPIAFPSPGLGLLKIGPKEEDREDGGGRVGGGSASRSYTLFLFTLYGMWGHLSKIINKHNQPEALSAE